MRGVRISRELFHRSPRLAYGVRRFEIRREHLTLFTWKLGGLRSVAKIIYRKAAAEVYVLKFVAGLFMDQQQRSKQHLERLGVSVRLGVLRSDVKVNSA